MKILVLGAASWNRMIYTDHLPTGQSATVFGADWREAAGSTGMGKALAARALGHDVTLHAVLGQDERAARIKQFAAAQGIQLLVDHDPAHPTPHHLNIMDAKGGRISYLLENGPADPLLDRVRLAEAIGAADAIFASLCGSTRMILDMLAQAQAPVHVDLHDWDGINPWHRPFIAAADMIQLSIEGLSAPQQSAQALLNARCGEVVLTKGAAGAEVITMQGAQPIPPCPAQIRDSNGAGDAFATVYFLARLQGQPVPEAGRLAAAAGALAVESWALMPADLSMPRLLERAQRSQP